MINVYEDNSVYVGEMISGQKNGRGALYILDDFFEGYKVDGNWQNDKLNGWATITTKTYTEAGNFHNGVKIGHFLRTYNDGRHSDISYNKGKNISEEVFAHYGKRKDILFGFKKLSDSEYYVGDTFDGLPFGYGMIYNVDTNKNKITAKTFGEIYGHRLVQQIEINKQVQEDEDTIIK